VAIDGDVLAEAAAAVTDGRRDYSEFWRTLLNLGREVQANGLVPAFCCIALPEQVLVHAEVAWFTGVHFLALVSDRATAQERLLARPGAPSAIANAKRHLCVNDALRSANIPKPHTFTALDTTQLTPQQTVASATAWASAVVG
jgi:hypothetical protein